MVSHCEDSLCKGAFTRSNIRDDFSVLNHDDFSDLNQNVLFDVHTAA